MQSTHDNLNSISEVATGNGKSATPFSQQRVVLTKQDYIRLKWEANYWRAQHAGAGTRSGPEGTSRKCLSSGSRPEPTPLRDQERESCRSRGCGQSKPASPRPRGQQPGMQGHGRSDRSALPVVPEVHDLSDAAKHCPVCGEAFAPFPGAEKSDIIAVQVQAHLRRIQRRAYQKTCPCPQVSGIVTAAPAPRVIPKSPLGVSLWTTVSWTKTSMAAPPIGLCEQLQTSWFPLSQGTLTDGLQRIEGLFEPVMPVLYERQMGEKLFHGDETRWEVFEEVEGKTGHRWYLWVMQSASVVYYRMAPGRGLMCPKRTLPSCARTW